MKVVLVYPRFPDPDNAYKVPPLGLASLAAYTRKYFQGPLDVRILDANAFNLTVPAACGQLLAAAPDIVGISLMTPQADFAYALTRSLKDAGSQAIVVHGGSHATALPQRSLAAGADYVVIGEGEETLVELLHCVSQGRPMHEVAGLALMHNGQVHCTAARPLIMDLGSIPPPAWDLFDHSAYNENIHISIQDYALPIMGSRGCPYDCSFCGSASMWHRRLRFRNPADVVSEMMDGMIERGVSYFHFYDDDLMVKRAWVEELCHEVQASITCKWVCLTRAADINRHADLLPLLKQAGCAGFEIGVESADETVLQQVEKKQILSEVERAFLNIAHAGFEYLGMQLMTFNEGETVEGHYRQRVFLNRLLDSIAPYRIQTSVDNCLPFLGQFATPYPGTRFYNSAPHTGLVVAKSWSDYTTSRINYIPNTLLRRPLHLTARPDETVVQTLERVSQQVIFTWPDYTPTDAHELDELIPTFLKLLDQHLTLEAIADALKTRFGLDDYLTLKFAAVSLVTVGQLGIVKSQA